MGYVLSLHISNAIEQYIGVVLIPQQNINNDVEM